jgi:kynurenine formamidase
VEGIEIRREDIWTSVAIMGVRVRATPKSFQPQVGRQPDVSQIGPAHHLWTLLNQLQQHRFVDLTHTFAPGIPRAPDMPDEKRSVLYDHDPDGWQVHLYQHAGQWGTHVDPPVHACAGGRTVDQISPSEMMLPLVVIDIEDAVVDAPDYAVTIADITEWENRHGQIPRQAFVALKTGWSRRWPNQVKMDNCDALGVRHSPGWSLPALDFLCQQRDIAVCGHETADTDPGILVSEDQFPAEEYLLSQGKHQIELLSSLDDVPPAGSIVVATFPKPFKGSGFPARVFAICPKAWSDPRIHLTSEA